uniref:Uncharacterized protein n=1 Tax=Ignisphaera aggregans TaxID=334771 RepID=A0A7C2ZUV6_9CREN
MDKIKLVAGIYNKVIDSVTTKKDVVLAPVFCNCFINSVIDGDKYAVIPRSIFLLLKRPLCSNPYDFGLFLNDVNLWYNRLKKSISGNNTFIFLFDPIRIPFIMMNYVPLLITNETIDGINLMTCASETDCNALALFNEFYLVLGLWSLSEENYFNKLATYIEPYTTTKISNPLFYSNPFDARSSINVLSIYSDDMLYSTYAESKASNLVIEFTTSITHRFGLGYEDAVYLWFSVPSSRILPIVNKYVNRLNVGRMLIISLINNIAELGSICTDRIWLSTLRLLTRAKAIDIMVCKTSET